MEPRYPKLKQYVRQMGSDANFAKRLEEAGYECSRSTVNALCNHGRLPKREPLRFKAAINIVLRRHGYSPAAAWRASKAAPGITNPAKNRGAGRKCNGGNSHQPPKQGEHSMTNKTKESLAPEHLQHFGLKAHPFFNLGDHRVIWLSEQMSYVKSLVESSVQNQDMVIITGNYGDGKSTLLRHTLRGMLASPSYHVIMPDRLDRKAMRGDMLVTAILDSMCAPGTKLPRDAVKRDSLARNLLTRATRRGEFPVMVIDEAHDLKEEIFIALKRLWDSGLIFRTLAIVLAGAGGKDETGQPWGLRWEIEGNPHLKEFAERVHLVDLGRLVRDLPKYLEWRFKAIGADLNGIFDAEAVDLLAERGRTFLLTENLTIRAMREAFLDGSLKVTANHALGA